MIDEKLAQLRARRNNIHRYHRLLKTELTEFERQYIERRLSEERSAMQELTASTFPLTFRMSIGEVKNATMSDTKSSYG
jgi:hypothetical protein